MCGMVGKLTCYTKQHSGESRKKLSVQSLTEAGPNPSMDVIHIIARLHQATNKRIETCLRSLADLTLKQSFSE